MTQILNLIALAGVAAWTITLVIAHLARLSDDNWVTNNISHYLTGKDGLAVDAGFYALAIGLFALAAMLGGVPAIFYVIGGAGTAGAAVTRAVWPNGRWHIRAAGCAFGGIGAADIAASIGHPAMLVLACMAPVVALITIKERSDTAIQEKSTAALYIAWVGAFTISALFGHPLA